MSRRARRSTCMDRFHELRLRKLQPVDCDVTDSVGDKNSLENAFECPRDFCEFSDLVIRPPRTPTQGFVMIGFLVLLHFEFGSCVCEGRARRVFSRPDVRRNFSHWITFSWTLATTGFWLARLFFFYCCPQLWRNHHWKSIFVNLIKVLSTAHPDTLELSVLTPTSVKNPTGSREGALKNGASRGSFVATGWSSLCQNLLNSTPWNWVTGSSFKKRASRRRNHPLRWQPCRVDRQEGHFRRSPSISL